MKYAFLLGIFLLFWGLNWSQKTKGKLTPLPLVNNGVLIENKGQWVDPVLFMAKKEGGKWWVMENKFIYHLQDFSALAHGHEKMDRGMQQTVVHANFMGSKPLSEVVKKGKTAFYYNYMLGKDSSHWASEVHGYTEVIRKELYDGIDLKVGVRDKEHEYSFLLAPGANPKDIKIDYFGQKKIGVNRQGSLVLSTDIGTIEEQRLLAYQVINGVRKNVRCSFEVNGSTVGFNVGNYDLQYPLIIDPVLVFATYNGAVSDNFGMTATYGSNGEAFSAGMVYGNSFPIPNGTAFDPTGNFTAPVNLGIFGITDVFITKYNSTGTALLWATYLGGGTTTQGTETAHSLICDSLDNVLLFGATSSTDFPTTPGAFQTNHAGGTLANFDFNGVYFQNQGSDIFISKISANGQNLLASTYVGGSGNDGVNYKVTSLPYNGAILYDSLTTNYGDQFRGEIMLDATGNVLIASCTRSLNFPLMNPFQPALAGGQDGVIFRLNPSLTALQFSSYYGGSQNDACYSVKVDTLNNILTCGGTSSSNLTGINGLMGSYQGGKADGFVIKINPSGTVLLAGTYLGRTQYDQAFFVEIDRDNKVYVLGQSVGGTFPIWNAPYNNPNSSQFIIKLSDNLGTNLASATIGNGSPGINISPSAFLVDICGNMYVSGWGANILQGTPLAGMPTTANAFQATTTGFDFYLMTIEHDFLSLLYATYMGGPNATEHVDGGTSRFDKNGVVYQSVCGGCGGWSDFPTTPGAYSSLNNSSNCNNLLFKFDFQLIPSAQFVANQTMGCEDFQVTFNNFSSQNDDYLWDFGNNNTTSTIFNPTITYTDPGVYQVFLYVTDSICNLTDTAEITITVLDSIQFTLFDTLGLCSNQPYTLGISTNGTASTIIWSQSPTFVPPLNNPNDSTILITSANPGWYYVSASNTFCERTDSVFVQFDVPVLANYQPSLENGCSPVTIQFNNSSTVTSNFYWDFGNGVVDSVTFEPQVTYPSPGQYLTQLIIFDSICNTSDTASITISVYPSVSFSLPNVLYLCSDSTVVLSPTAITGGANDFIWSSTNQFLDTLNASVTDSTLELLVPTSGWYYFRASNGDCSMVDSIQITVFSESISILGPDSVCLNTPTVYTATNSSQAPFTYAWGPITIIQGPSNQSSVTIMPPQAQYLYLEATSPNGCIVEDSIYVSVSYINPALVTATASPPVVNPGTSVTLTGTPSGLPIYQWVPALPVLNPTAQNTEAVVDETTVFTLLVSDGVCTVSDTTVVKVYEIICDGPYVYVPNAFSPNNDGNNDVLYVRGLFVEKMVFRVFDRWGEMVFESTDVNFGWDGRFKGRKLDPDVYDYYLQVTCYGGLENILKGNVTLMK